MSLPIRITLPFVALIRRELVRTLRRVRPFLFLLLLMMVGMLVVVGAYPRQILATTALRSASLELLVSFTMCLFGAAMLLLPAYGATAIVVEREQETYDLLALTLIRPSGIVLAKLLNTLGFFLLLVVATLPLLGSAFFLVGVDWDVLVYLAAVLAIVSMTCASAGVLASALMRSTVRSIMLSYALVLLALGGYLIPFGIVAYLIDTMGYSSWLRGFEPYFRYVAMGSPYVALMASFGPSGPLTAREAAVATGIAQGGFSVVALTVAWRMLARSSEERTFVAARAVGKATRKGPATALYARLKKLPERWNPAFVRELHSLMVAQRFTPPRLVVTGTFVLLVVSTLNFVQRYENLVDRGDEPAAAFFWICGMMVLMSIATPAVAATVWTREHDRNTADALRMTLLTPSQIVVGKLAAAVCAASLALILAAVCSAPLYRYVDASNSNFNLAVVAGLITLSITTVLCGTLGVMASIIAKRTTSAVLAAFAASGAVMIGPYVVMALSWITQFLEPGRNVGAWSFLSPFLAYVWNGADRELRDFSITPYWVASTIVHGLLTLLLIHATVRIFAGYRMRDP